MSGYWLVDRLYGRGPTHAAWSLGLLRVEKSFSHLQRKKPTDLTSPDLTRQLGPSFFAGFWSRRPAFPPSSSWWCEKQTSSRTVCTPSSSKPAQGMPDSKLKRKCKLRDPSSQATLVAPEPTPVFPRHRQEDQRWKWLSHTPRPIQLASLATSVSSRLSEYIHQGRKGGAKGGREGGRGKEGGRTIIEKDIRFF